MIPPPQRQLPIFPLSSVLFPQMMLPLQVFEDRYKRMLRDCLEADSRFGVALIKEGAEVGEPATPHTIGTVARIRRVSPGEDGRYGVLVLGERRFRIREMLQWKPYEKAVVSFPVEIEGDPPMSTNEVEAIRYKAAVFLRTLLGLQGGWSRKVESPTDPIDLSYYIASVTRGDPRRQQEILEALSARKRLELLLPLIESGAEANTKEMQERFLLKGTRLN
ncbi:MAG: LON peptidase substrate-binding domain-containing protein [Chloroflexi bacterium]|nr:LON peptidase substrate-binding domain-containing protein [Chloroflexota bacterium]